MSEVEDFTNQILRNCGYYGQTTGKYMFNCLPDDAQKRVRGKAFDPSEQDFHAFQIREWIESHLIFQNGEIVMVFDGNNVIWQTN